MDRLKSKIVKRLDAYSDSRVGFRGWDPFFSEWVGAFLLCRWLNRESIAILKARFRMPKALAVQV
jgi:hypothetical protein